MIHRFIFTFVFIFLFANLVTAQDYKPQHADKIIEVACKEAKTTDKNVFLIFHASWCSWCKRLEKAIQSDELKKIFNEHFVIIHLDVLERGDKVAALENPGAKDYMDKFGGEKSGLPFYVFLTPEQELISNSNVMPENSNIGYPGANEEIEAFGKLLKSSAIKMSDEQLETIQQYLKNNAPK